ncbi:hypothetical protein LOTGIDRAFT_233141 [Lottia gigantea]|uniref:Uncharacterized protein n=1 Tax=Lottia gigantea TaxID=225164 RepID=V3ZM00_LOTGI|nr:hypothetical protein LOTGIDRAFT_233141 [Lottia gigantea]ESO92373.1 hypothetical protein LOTGIDRAFT_233141 [Lottia gigantea]
MSTTAEDFLHRTYKSTNVSTPTTKLWRNDEQYESSDESYSEETILNVDNFTEESKLDGHVSDESMGGSLPIATTKTEISLPGSRRKTKIIDKKVISEGEVLRKNGRLLRMMYMLQLRKRSQSSPQTNAFDNTSASTSKSNQPQPEVQLVGAETPLKKHNDEVKKDVTKVTGEKVNRNPTQSSDPRRLLRKFINTGRIEH